MNAEQRPSVPQPTSEQPDQIAKLASRVDRLSDVIQRRRPLYEKLGMKDVAERMETGHALLEETLRTKLVEEADEFVVPDIFGNIADETKKAGAKRKEKIKKSRGLNDPRPIEFSVPGTGKKLRGKEGKGLKFLIRAARQTLDRDQLARKLYPGKKLEVARNNVNRTMHSARKHLVGSRFDVEVKRDYQKKTTFYSWVERSGKSKTKKKR